jgi:hypothetical protein
LNISNKPSTIKPAPSTSKKVKPDEDEISVNPGSKEKRAQQLAIEQREVANVYWDLLYLQILRYKSTRL